MVNRILLAYIFADILFVAMGGLELGFSIFVNNTKDDVADNGLQVARNLLYQRFPLTGWYQCVMSWMLSITSIFDLDVFCDEVATLRRDMERF